MPVRGFLSIFHFKVIIIYLKCCYFFTANQKSFGLWNAVNDGSNYENTFGYEHDSGTTNLHDEILAIVQNTGLEALAAGNMRRKFFI